MTETSRAFAGEHGAMNNWDKIWKKRTAEIENRATVFEMFKELKRADGFDTQDVQGYYEAFFRQWECRRSGSRRGVRERSAVCMRLAVEAV